MKKSLKVLGSMALLAATVMGASACSGSKNYTSKNTKYKIGVSGPLTGSAAVYGLGVENAAKMAVEEINKAGGVNGYELELIATDDQCKADLASTNYTNMYEQGMQLSLGCVTSGACLEYAGYAAKDKVFCLTPSATNDGVPAAGENMYQMCFSDSGQGTASAAYIEENYPNAKVGIFYDSSDAYSAGIYNNFVANYKGKTVSAAFTSDSKTSFDSQIQTLKDCDFIFMPIYYTEASIFIKQAKDTFSSDVVYFGCDGLDGIDSVTGFNVYDYSQEISYLSHFNAASTDEAVQSFVTKYTATYGTDTLNQFGAAAYDCIYTLAKALEIIKPAVTVTPSELCAKLEETFQDSTFSYSGVTGKNMTWNKDGTVSKTPTKFVVNAPKEA